MRSLIGVMAVLTVGPKAIAQGPSCAQQDSTQAHAALVASDRAFSAAYVRGDFAAMAAMYAPDGTLIPETRMVRGREAIQRFFTLAPGTRQVAHSLQIESLSLHGGTAVEVGIWSSTKQPSGSEPSTGSGRYLLVWECGRDGLWRIAYDMWHQPPRPGG